jgi:predicted Zn-ribbon and HTH transcriptional regulator
MANNKYEVADVINRFLPQMNQAKILIHHKRTLSAISRCRTAALGSHTDKCNDCGHIKISYNSCRNRHCPKCQGVEKEAWIVMQEDMMLPVVNYHVVFTLPHELNPLCLRNPKLMYDLLFKSAWQTLDTLARDPKWIGGQSAATMILHTWSQTMNLHPHLHCIVPNGGLSKDGSWQFPKRGNGNFLFPVLAMNKIFKAVFLKGLNKVLKKERLNLSSELDADSKTVKKVIQHLYTKEWVVYTKTPFAGVKHAINYLGRYSHRVAITNHRIIEINDKTVSFTYKDYVDGAKKKVETIDGVEFIRRFCMHILPSGFRKVRQYGFTSNASKAKSINKARVALGQRIVILLTRKERKEKAKSRIFGQPNQCPCCKKGEMVTIDTQEGNKDPPFVANPFTFIKR